MGLSAKVVTSLLVNYLVPFRYLTQTATAFLAKEKNDTA